MNIERVQSEIIRLYGGRSGGVRGGSQARGAADASGGAGASASSGDGFVISEEAAAARRLVGVVAAAPDVRDQLVAELRGRVQAGTYQTADEAVARRLLNLGGSD